MKLTLEQKRIKIAEACGWTLFSDGWARPDTQFYADGRPVPLDEITSFTEAGLPDYFSDLNAMHKAEESLTDYQWDQMFNLLIDIRWKDASSEQRKGIGTQKVLSPSRATAAQRAEAFGLTLNLWNENE